MSAITIEQDSIKIPVETTEKDGWVVLTISPVVTLILRAEKLNEYVPEKLEKIVQSLRAITEEPPMPAYYHPSKARLLKRLRERGISNISGGEEYDLKPLDVPLEKVRQGLASIKGSLSDEVIKQRNEQW
jgi:hypothetical protein